MPYSSKSAAAIAIEPLGITGGWVFTQLAIQHPPATLYSSPRDLNPYPMSSGD
jgi:hypothetical protein